MAESPATAAAPPLAQTSSSLVFDQLVYALRELAREPVLLVVSAGVPVALLVVLGIAETEPAPGAPAVVQSVAPRAGVLAAVLTTFAVLPFGIAVAREQGVLKRLRGTPLPIWAYLAGRLLAGLALAAAGTALMAALAVAAFGLEVSARMVPAVAVTFAVGAGCFAALGLALLALLRSSQAVLGFGVGAVMVVGLVSDLFGPAETAMPRWLEVVAWTLPLRHFAAAFAAAFDPAASLARAELVHLGALAAWGGLGAAIAARRWRWDAGGGRSASRRGAAGSRAPRVSARRRGRPPTAAGLLLAQVAHSVRALLRDRAGLFFSVAFPALFVAIAPAAFGNPELDGRSLAELMTLALAVFGVAVTAYVNMPEMVATARDRGVLKRLRGTPLPGWVFVAGRLGSALLVSLVAVVLVLATGTVLHGVRIEAAALPALALVLLLAALAFAGIGLAVAALSPSAKAVPAIALGTLLPLSFISDVLAFGVEMPPVVDAVGWAFPLKHLMHATRDAAADGTVTWLHLGAALAWGAAAAAVATRWFRWEPRTG